MKCAKINFVYKLIVTYLWIYRNSSRSIDDLPTANYERNNCSNRSMNDGNGGFTDRIPRLNESDQYNIRRSNYHGTDMRGRGRDRHYRNGPYNSIMDR